MSLEYTILLISWIVTIILLLILIPKERIREAWIILLFMQMMTWLVGLIVVQLGLIEYPVRLFSYANSTSFTFEFFIYPAFCVIFNLHFPNNKRKMSKILYYIIFVAFLTITEVLLERNTKLITYVKWEWYVTAITLYLTFLFSRMFYLWFFKNLVKLQKES